MRPFTHGLSHLAQHQNANLITIEVSSALPDQLHVFYDLNGALDELWRCQSTAFGTWDPTPLKSNLNLLYGGGNGFGVSQTNGQDVYIDHNYTGSSVGRYVTLVGGTWIDYYPDHNHTPDNQKTIRKHRHLLS